MAVLMLLTSGLLTLTLTSAASPNCLTVANNNCGSIIGTSPDDPNLYIYKFSEQEISGTCSREGITYANVGQTFVTSNTLEQCRCKDATCETCFTGKQRVLQTLATNCCGQMIDFTYSGVTYYQHVPSDQTPECCFAYELDAAGKTTHICYCPSTTTTCLPVCPVPPTSVSSPLARIIYSRPVDTDACSRNIAVFRVSANKQTVCQAPLAYHPTGTDSSGNKLTKPVYLLLKRCADSIDLLLKNNNIEVTIGSTTFAYKVAEVTKTELADKKFVAVTFNSYPGPCTKKPECTYNKATMGDLDTANCYFLSFGDSKPGSALARADVFLIQSCQDSLDNAAECFYVKDAAQYTNGTDLGAPLYCPVKTTGEEVLYGLFSILGTVGTKTKQFPVLTI